LVAVAVSRFLTEPRAEYDPGRYFAFGTETCHLRLGDLSISVNGLSRAQLACLQHNYAGYIHELPDDHSMTAVSVAVHDTPESAFHLKFPPAWVYDMEIIHQPDRVDVSGHGFFGSVAIASPLVANIFTCHKAPDYFHGAFENFVRLLLSYALLENNSLLLHSAGVIVNTGALIFPGYSGAGKTTLSQLAEEAGLSVASDDLNAVVLDSGRCFLSALPFRGDLGGRTPPGRYLLNGFLLHRKAEQHRILPVSRAQFIARLLACSPYVNHDPFRRERLISLIERIADNTRYALLDFRRDAGVWQTIEIESFYGH
jgi:hypothetical protein